MENKPHDPMNIALDPRTWSKTGKSLLMIAVIFLVAIVSALLNGRPAFSPETLGQFKTVMCVLYLARLFRNV